MTPDHDATNQSTDPTEDSAPSLRSHRKTAKRSGATFKGRFEDNIPEGYATLSESEALEILEKGHRLERHYIQHLNMSDVVSKNILLRDVYIYELNIDHADVQRTVSLQGCRINRLHMNQSQFHDAVALKHCSIHFSHIHGCNFERGLNAELSSIESKAILHQNTFHGRVRFWEAHFKDWVNINECTFKDRLDMRSAVLEAGLTMPDCVFEGDVLFRGTHIALKWEAENARFDQLVDFSKAKLNDFVYLVDVKQGPEQRWAFWNTVSERIMISAKQVEGRLLSEENEDYAQAMREYTVLKRSFEYGNYYSREDWAFYRFKVNERRAREKSWNNPFSKLLEFADWLFLDWGCGYGTNPLRAIRTSIVIIMAFAAIYTMGFGMLHISDDAQLPFPELGVNHLMNQISVSLFISLAAFTSGFGDLREVAIGWMNVPLMTEALLGTLMWGLFVVAFGRKVIR